MTKENVIKLYNHFCYLAEGKFSERDFEYNLGGVQGVIGRHSIEELTPERKSLIISDATENKKDLEEKFPFLKEKEKTKKGGDE